VYDEKETFFVSYGNLETTINLTSMTNGMNGDVKRDPIDAVNHAIIPHSDPIKIFGAGEFNGIIR
jgi:hypothetical protein